VSERARSLLSINNIEVIYDHVILVLKGVSLQVPEEGIVALLGANGAGKTTTLKALAGLLRPAAGHIHYNGEDMMARPAYERVRLGLALVPEGRGVFGRLTVEENLAMGAYSRRDAAGIAADFDRVYGLLPRLAERRRQLGGTLSGGEQQMLAIGRAIMSRPRLLLLDEPSMGLAPLMVQKIFETIRTVAAEGMTLLLVEQNARLALETCHRGYVMESGQISLAAAAQQLLADPRVRQAYLGE
jgi:branched-chain amino acid transport system ATP-binding protein